MLDEFQKLAEIGDWSNALAIIEKIVQTNPNITTSWFNHGICLDALERHSEAAQSFLKAYELDEDNYSAQYRAFRNLALAKNSAAFGVFLENELHNAPEIPDLLCEDDVFNEILSDALIINIIQKYRSSI